jgi:hypothetical protein
MHNLVNFEAKKVAHRILESFETGFSGCTNGVSRVKAKCGNVEISKNSPNFLFKLHFYQNGMS